MVELIHLQTQIRTIFGRVDEEGNVVEQYPLNLNLKALNEEVFVESLAQIVKARKDLSDHSFYNETDYSYRNDIQQPK